MIKAISFTLPFLLFSISAFGQSVPCNYKPGLSNGVEVRLRVNAKKDASEISQKTGNLLSRVESINTQIDKGCTLVEKSIKLSSFPLRKAGTLKGTFHFQAGSDNSKCVASLREVIQNPYNNMFEDGIKFEELNFCTNFSIRNDRDNSARNSSWPVNR